MRLTMEKRIEINLKSDRIKAIRDEALSDQRSTRLNHQLTFGLTQILHREELNAHKVRLEILFSETDIKEQSKHHR